MDIPAILAALRPGESWKLDGDEYEGLTWTDTTEKPTLKEIEKAWPVVQQAQGFAAIRAERNDRLAACDWTQLPDAPADAAAWKKYRQQLRDLLEDLENPNDVQWPVPPQ